MIVAENSLMIVLDNCYPQHMIKSLAVHSCAMGTPSHATIAMIGLWMWQLQSLVYRKLVDRPMYYVMLILLVILCVDAWWLKAACPKMKASPG